MWSDGYEYVLLLLRVRIQFPPSKYMWVHVYSAFEQENYSRPFTYE